MPRLYIQREDVIGGYNYVPLAERLDIDHLLAGLRANREEWEHVMPKGDRNTTSKKEPWNDLSPTRICVKTSVGRLSQFVSPKLHTLFDKMEDKSDVSLTLGVTDHWADQGGRMWRNRPLASRVGPGRA